MVPQEMQCTAKHFSQNRIEEGGLAEDGEGCGSSLEFFHLQKSPHDPMWVRVEEFVLLGLPNVLFVSRCCVWYGLGSFLSWISDAHHTYRSARNVQDGAFHFGAMRTELRPNTAAAGNSLCC